MTVDWRRRLRKLVLADTGNSRITPLSRAMFKASPPSGLPWPEELPTYEGILDFYSICDGGDLAWFRWSKLAALLTLNELWFDTLKDYYTGGRSPVARGRHTVVANDAAGAPLIWDAATGKMATFYWKGGDWEPLASSFEEDMTDLFHPKEDGAGWQEALAQLDDLVLQPEATLGDLDAFLRRLWLECCDHLSGFEVRRDRYSRGREISMNKAIYHVLAPGEECSYTYDYGSSTNLVVRALAAVPTWSDSDRILVLARNLFPEFPCRVCGEAPATSLCRECNWEGEGWLCEKCALEHSCDEEMLSEVVNSPRVGVCGYTG